MRADRSADVTTIALQVLRRDPLAEGGRLALARPVAAPDERLMLWEGLSPLPIPDHVNIAAVSHTGDLGGRKAYIERLPVGYRLDEVQLPHELMIYVVVHVLDAIAHLHLHRQLHGALRPDRVWLGMGGEVVLFGRGRRGGLQSMDLVAAVSLLPQFGDETLPGESADLAAHELRRHVPRDARAKIVAFLQKKGVPVVAPQELVDLDVDAGTDEVVPDFGDDSTGGDGILDRWSTTTGSHGETTPAVTTTSPNVADPLWAAVDRALETPLDTANVRPSALRGLRQILAEEGPEMIRVPAAGPLPRPTPLPDTEDQPTAIQAGFSAPAAEDRTARMPVYRPPPPSIPPTNPWRRPVELLVAVAIGALLATILSYLL